MGSREFKCRAGDDRWWCVAVSGAGSGLLLLELVGPLLGGVESVQLVVGGLGRMD